MDASYKIQRGIHVHLIQFFMCPEFWVHINVLPPLFNRLKISADFTDLLLTFTGDTSYNSKIICILSGEDQVWRE